MPKKMTDDMIVARLTYAAGQAVGFSESKLSKEREKVRRLYEGERPEKISAGDSGYTSRDVFDAVEAMKAQLLEVISATHHPVAFLPAQGEDASAGMARADWCNNVLFTQNRGFEVLQTVIDDGLMNRNGIVKVYWKKDFSKSTYDLSDTTMEELSAHMADTPDAEIEDYTVNDEDGTLKRVRLTVKKDRSRIVVEPVPADEFGISPMATSIEKAEVVFHRRRMTVSDLIKDGYPKDKVDELQSDDKAWEAADGDRYTRYGQTDDMVGEDSLGDGSDSRRRCVVVEAYTELDVDGTGTSRLYKVTYVGATLLDKEPVERSPFVDFAPLPRSHAFWGTNYAKLLESTQTARTYLTRSIINHALITNNPRLQVVRGAVTNPRELMENRLGGIVNVTRPDGIAPIPQQGLNPFVFQTIGLLDTDKEEITGISKLSQGLDKNAISSQNSQGMVQDLITNSQTRQKVIARNFAERFLRHLFTLIYRLTVENEDRAKVMQIAGSWVPVDFTEWPEDVEVEIALTLGADAQAKETQKWVILDKMLSSDPGLAIFYPKEKRYAVMSKALQSSGIKNVNDYILKPEEIQPPQPSPMDLADLEVKKADAEVKRANAKAAEFNAHLHAQEAQTKHEETSRKLDLAEKKEADHADNARDQLAHRVATDAAELRLSVEALKVNKLSATASPRG